jgi:hypothetical protein
MKNWLPFVSGPALAIASAPALVLAGDGLVLELVAGAAGPDARALERGLLAVLPVSALDHEARDDAMEDHVVIEAIGGKIDEVLRRLRGGLVEQLDLDVADLGRDGGAGHGQAPSWATGS